MLHVAIHRDDGITLGMVDAAGQRGLMSVVARKPECTDMRVGRHGLSQDLAAFLSRTVIDKKNFIVIRQPRHRFVDSRHEMRDVLRLIVDRHDDRDGLSCICFCLRFF